MIGTARTRAQNKYISKAYDRVNLTMPKGRKAEIQTHAEALGTSINGYINQAIDEAMERDKRAQEGSDGPSEGSGD